MLNTRSEESKTGFYTHYAYFVNTSSLKYARIHVIHRVHQAEYVIRILVAAPQESMNRDPTCRLRGPGRDRGWP